MLIVVRDNKDGLNFSTPVNTPNEKGKTFKVYKWVP